MASLDYIPLSTRLRSIVVGVPAKELTAWFKAMPGLREWGNSALRRKLSVYRQHQVTPAFVSELTPAVIAAFGDGKYRFLGTDAPIILNALYQEGIPTGYFLPLVAAGAALEDISRFWGDGIELEYALSLLSRS